MEEIRGLIQDIHVDSNKVQLISIEKNILG